MNVNNHTPHAALKPSVLAATILVSITSITAHATNGLAPTGLGNDHRAMGGAATGNPINSSSIASNPAAASFVDDGYDLGVELFQPDRSASAGGMTFSGNGKENFIIPEGAYKRSTASGLDLGLVVYGNGGMNTEYKTNPGFGSGTAGVDYQQLFIAPTLSYKLNENNAFGASINLVYHKFKAYGITGFGGFSSDPTKFSDNGYDSSTGAGLTLGWQGRISPSLTAGLAYRSKVRMGKLDKYSGLFPNAGSFDVPAATSAGVGWEISDSTQLALDVQRIHYSDVSSIGNSSLIQAPFGSNGGPGFGWDDITVYKLGMRHRLNPNLALMAGFNYGGNPVKSSETTLNVLAPGVTQKHLSLGAQIATSPKSSITISYMHALSNEVIGDKSSMMSGYDLKMEQNSMAISFSHKF